MSGTESIFSDNWEKLQLPESIKIVRGKPSDDNSRYAKFTLEPLNKGFGVTIGHSLRRTLLSSLVGCAVTAVRIDGVAHELDVIKGVREDVLAIVLNLKQVKLAPLVNEQEFLVRLDIQGPKVVTAADIETNELLVVNNPDLVICHVDEEVPVKASIQVKMGRGLVSADEKQRRRTSHRYHFP